MQNWKKLASKLNKDNCLDNIDEITYYLRYYIGLKKFSLRIKADNFYEDEYKTITELKKQFPKGAEGSLLPDDNAEVIKLTHYPEIALWPRLADDFLTNLFLAEAGALT